MPMNAANHTMPTAFDPWEFTIRGDAPSLKNSRSPFVYHKKGMPMKMIGKQKWVRMSDVGFGLPPSTEVTQFIQLAKSAFERQRPTGRLVNGEWNLISMPTEVCFLLITQAHALTSIPDKDTDNMLQTIQEAMQGTIIENDRQVQSPWPYRIATQNRMNIHHRIWFWITEGRKKYPKEVEMVLNHPNVVKFFQED